MVEKLIDSTSAGGRGGGASSWLIALVSTAALMAVIDGTIVTASLQPIADDLGASLQTAAWFTAAYLVAAGVTMPLSGWIIDRLTARRTLLISLVLFVAGSVLCALATEAVSLIVFRVLQGLGGGLLEPTTLTIAATAAGPSRMGRVMGIVSGVINIAPILGPLLGGLLAGTGHWQWIFLINVPIGLVVLVGALRLMPVDPDRPGGIERPDLRGMALLPTGFVLVLLGVESVGSSRWAPIAVIVGVLLLVGYAARTLRGARPAALDLRMLAIPGFRAGLAVMAAAGFTMYFQLVALALLAQQRWGFSGVASGLLVAVLGVGLLVSMTISGRMSDSVGARVIVTYAAAALATLAAVLALVHDHVPLAVLAVLVLAIGLAFGAVAAPAFSSVYRVVEPDRVPYATPSLFVTVQLCAAVGATVAAQLTARASVGQAVTIGYFMIAGAFVLATFAARGLPGRD